MTKDDAGTNRVEVDVADEFPEVHLLFTEHGLVAVLENLAVPFVPLVESDDIARKESPHEVGDTRGAAPQKKMGVVGHEGPGVAGCTCLRQEGGQPDDEVVPFPGIPEYVPSLYAADHDMMEGACCIETGLSRHAQMIPSALR